MKKLLLSLTLLLVCIMANAQSRRPIDPQHPMWLIHVDAWNYPDPQKIIDLIPEDIKPYVCINLSLSCAFNKQTGYHQKPENAVLTFKSWATVCCQNNVWFMLQHASGGHCHIKDDDLDTFEYFFKHYKNFLGWNYAEQFWGFGENGDEYSMTDVSRIALFAKLVPMSHKYGGLLCVSFCGNIYSHPLNPMAMMKRNSDLLNACRQYPEAILWCYKYTTAACWYNNESVCLGPFVSGLAKNYGLRYDNCGWDGATDGYEKAKTGNNDYKRNRTYPESVGIGPVLDQIVNNGACVFDGPELIWTQCFRETGATYSEGYRFRNWGTYTQFDNIWVDMFRKMLDGTIHIATRDEVIDRTKIAVEQDFPIAQDDGYWQKWKAYATKDDMYDGLYKQNDPLNYQSGNKDQNWLFFKKTGRYQAIPVVNGFYDSKAQSIPVKVKQTDIVAGRVWGNQSTKVNQFNQYYPQEYTGDLFASRHKNEWVIYYPFSYYYNYEKTASASMDLKYNTCSKMELTMQKFDAGVVKEFSDHLDVYLNNFRTDTTAIKTATIKITGASSRPSYTSKNRSNNNNISGGLNISENWSNNVYTLTVKHMGPVDIKINCRGNASGKLSNYLSDNILTPVQPESDYFGPLITEAEVMGTKNVAQVVTDAYPQQNSIHNHAGLGFVMMGTNASAAIMANVKANKSGNHYVKFRYSAPNGGMTNYRLCIDSESNEVATVTFNNTGSYSSWQESSNTVNLSAGAHKIYLKAVAGGSNLAIDQMTLVPTDYQEEIISSDGAPFNYDTESGRYMADFNYFTSGGDLQFDKSTGKVTIPAGKAGTLTYKFTGANFSNVSRIKLDHTGDDLFSTLTITSNGNVINNGSAFWSSKYLLNFTNYQHESSNVTTLVWNGDNRGGDSDKTMTINQLLVQVDVLRADQRHEIPLTADMYKEWSGSGAGATENATATSDYNTDVVLGGYGVIYGSSSVAANLYADLSKYSKLRIYGDNGLEVRALFNRSTDTSSDYVEKSEVIDGNVFEIDLTEVGDFAHLNSIKVKANNVKGMVWRIMLVDDDCPIDYYIYGKSPRTNSLENALNDAEATNYDATALTNVTDADLTTKNLNALIYVTDAAKVANDHNVVVKSGNSYSAQNIVLTDAAAAAADTAPAYLPGTTPHNATWTQDPDNNQLFTFEWTQGASEPWAEIMHYVNNSESQHGCQFRYLMVDTEEFTAKWGVMFLDGSENVLAKQEYWNPMNDGNKTKILDVDELFAKAGNTANRGNLTKIRIYAFDTSTAGKVVVKNAYLYNDAADFAYPFFAPFDINAANAKLSTAIGNEGLTTICLPFNADVPADFNAFSLSETGATAVNAAEANRPLLLTGSGTAEFNETNVVVKATDKLENGILKGVYRLTAAPAGSYVQYSTDGASSFAPVQGTKLYQVTESSNVSLNPFRAYATQAIQQQEPDDPKEPYTLTVTTAGIATLYLDYDAVIPDEDFFLVTTVKSVDGPNAYLKEIKKGIIPANTGVIIFANPGTYKIYPSDVPATETVNSLLHGVVVNTPVSTIREMEDGAYIYILSRGIEEYTGFKPVGSSMKTLYAYKAYLPLVQVQEAKIINICFGGEVVTGIDDIKAAADKDNNSDGVIYDLSGRVVTNPQKGIYIVNGKKILIK